MDKEEGEDDLQIRASDGYFGFFFIVTLFLLLRFFFSLFRLLLLSFSDFLSEL